MLATEQIKRVKKKMEIEITGMGLIEFCHHLIRKEKLCLEEF